MVSIELELIDAEGVIKIDEDGNLFKDLIRNAVRECATADSYLAINVNTRPEVEQVITSYCCTGSVREEEPDKIQNNIELMEKLKTTIRRSIRVSDKYLRLLSLLIKSREFHMAYPTSETPGNRPVIELPKSREGKPFVPTRTGDPSEKHDFNVSHQHPYLGIARGKGIKKVGMDIVTFDEFNTRLYKDETDFVNVFQSSFAESEWHSIVKAKSILHEFYLQWAVKEAYTKALGLGLSMDFKSFTTKLDGVENLWEHVLSNADDTGKGIILSGSVCHSSKPAEPWTFFFSLLRSNGELRGCVCVCVGPSEGSIEDRLTVDVNWMEVEGLLEWHNKKR